MQSALLLACLFVLLFQADLFAEDKAKAYDAYQRRSSELTRIFSNSPLQIHATFRVHLRDAQQTGTYQTIQFSRGEYAEEIQTSFFNSSVRHIHGVKYSLQSKAFEPLTISYLRQLFSVGYNAPAGAPVSKITNSVQSGRRIKCFAQERGQFPRSQFSGHEACFDEETGALVSFEWSFNWEVHRLEYSDFRKDGEKLFPYRMKRFHNGRLLLDLSVVSLNHEALDKKLVEPPPEAVRQEQCNKFKPAEINYRSGYFDIRSDHKGGSVVIAGSLDDRGKLKEKEIQQSAGEKMDKAAMDALKEVYFRPAQCDGKKIPSLFRFQIWFSPALHPDSFESFR